MWQRVDSCLVCAWIGKSCVVFSSPTTTAVPLTRHRATRLSMTARGGSLRAGRAEKGGMRRRR